MTAGDSSQRRTGRRVEAGVSKLSSLRHNNSGSRPSNPPPPSEFSSGLSAYGAPSSAGSLPPSSVHRQNSDPPASAPASGGYSKPPPVSVEQSRQIAKTHFEALRDWLTRENALANASTRNNAREKLTRLTRQQFQELSTDVYDELVRRLEDAAGRPGDQPFLSVRGDFHPKRNQARQKLATLPLQRFRDLASDVYFELERRYPEFADEVEPPRAPSPAAYSPPPSAPSNNSNPRRIPTPNGGSLASNDVVVPNKSTFVMEEPAPMNNYGGERQSEYGDEYEERDGGRATARASEVSSVGTRFIGNYAGSAPPSEAGGRRSWEYAEKEKIKSDYEYKLAVAQNRITELERENEDARDALKRKSAEASRARELESQVRSHRERYEDQSATLQRLQSDNTPLQSSRSRDVANVDSSRLRQDLDRLTRERGESDELANELRGEVSSLVDELRSVNVRYEELLDEREREKAEMKRREEEERGWRRKYEQAKTELRNVKATSQLFSGQIKVEGDHMPASSDGLIADVFVAAFQTSIDDLLQAARSKMPSSVLTAMRAVAGAVESLNADVKAIDARRISSLPPADQDRLRLLQSKTTATLSNLTTASKNHAVSFGVSPVSLLDAAASHLSATIVDLVRILKIRRTISSAHPSGPSRDPSPPAPVSQAYDGGRTPSLNNARSVPSRDNSDPRPASPRLGNAAPSANEYNPSLRVNDRAYASPNLGAERERDDGRYGQVRQQQPPSAGYGRSNGKQQSGVVGPFAPTDWRSNEAAQKQDAYQQGGREYPEPPRGSVLTYGSPEIPQDRAVDSWEELKNYLENQTEAIVHSIQSLLSAIRSGAQGEQLNENLTQIITIVSSICAISKDALPNHSRAEGDEILRDLADNCDRLSEMQSQESSTTVFTKQTKQAMASASFGVAKSLKALNALLSRGRENESLT